MSINFAIAKGAQAPSIWILTLGAVIFVAPTFVSVARDSWSTQQGGGGPFILAVGLWLILRERSSIWEVARPGRLGIGLAALASMLAITILARITGIIEIEGFAMYAALISVGYLLLGGTALKRIWFPLLFLGFIFPPPDTLFALITQPLKIAVSQWSVALLFAAGFPIAVSGVTIQIAQYQLLVADACAGVNSIISLTALGLFYAYFRHGQDWSRMMILIAAIIPVAVAANLIRVMALILITYFFGGAAGQGFAHEFAGMSTFAAALLLTFFIDLCISKLLARYRLRQNA